MNANDNLDLNPVIKHMRAEKKGVHVLSAIVILSALFLAACDDSDSFKPFSRQFVDVSPFMIEDNLLFDEMNNPTGIFTSDDNDESSFSDFVARQQLIAVGDLQVASTMSYLEAGDPDGDPIVLVHGQPTQAFLWRHVIPLLPQDARIIAVDLIGYGESSKPDIDFTFKQHAAYLRAFIETLKLDDKPITFVAHDIGSVPALAYASRFPENIKGYAFFESMLGPVPSFDVMPEQAQFFRTADGNASIISENTFIEVMLISEEMSSHHFTDEELAVYRKPFIEEIERDVLAIVPLEVPIIGGAPDGFGDTNIELLGRNVQYLMTDPVSKLFMYSEQGVLIPSVAVESVIANFNPENSLVAVDVGDAKHFWQEEIPEVLAAEISFWYRSLPGNSESN